MVGMRERMSFVGGVIHWKTKPGSGCQLIATVPLVGASQNGPTGEAKPP